MKRLLIPVAAAMAIAGCDTYPQGDPYAAPYPAPMPPTDPYASPYPGPYPAPYPGSQQPLPGGPLPPGASIPMPPGSPADCPIARSGQWNAFVDTMPGPGASGATPTLVVTGSVVTQRGGYRAEFDPYLQTEPGEPGRIVARLRLRSDPSAPGAGAQTHDVRWQWPLQTPIGSLTLVCGDRTLATISPVAAAR